MMKTSPRSAMSSHAAVTQSVAPDLAYKDDFSRSRIAATSGLCIELLTCFPEKFTPVPAKHDLSKNQVEHKTNLLKGK
jgi:hypothetical protein